MNKILLFIFLFISIPAFADTVDIYCPKCHKFLWTLNYDDPLTLDDLKAKNFIDRSDFKVVDNTRFICPIDGTPLNGWEYWAWERNMHPPVMAYPALTVMTLDEKGDFVWFPDKVEVSNN